MRKRRKRVARFRCRKLIYENPKKLRMKIWRISNDLGLGQEQMIAKDDFITHCPHCNQKTVLRIYLDVPNNVIVYDCKTGCNPEDVRESVIDKLVYARPWISGFLY